VLALTIRSSAAFGEVATFSFPTHFSLRPQSRKDGLSSARARLASRRRRAMGTADVPGSALLGGAAPGITVGQALAPAAQRSTLVRDARHRAGRPSVSGLHLSACL
jgi:hypothetical protein